MIILISGASCTGKTLMSHKLMVQHKIPYYSIDHLKMGLYRGLNGCEFTPMDSNEHIGAKLWPIIKGIIMTAIENGQSLIIEGAYILPEYIQEFESKYLAHILPIFICFSKDYVETHYQKSILSHRSVIESRLYEETRTSSDFVNEHAFFMEKCEKYQMPYFIIKSDYEGEIASVYQLIHSKLG